MLPGPNFWGVEPEPLRHPQRHSWVMAMAVCAALGSACSGKSDAPTSEGDPLPPEDAKPLEGIWTARGVDDVLGEVTVQLGFEEDGQLAIGVLLSESVRLDFRGTWEIAGDTLTLSSAYFEPAGQARVICSARGDSVLIFQDDEGRTEEWRRS